MTALFGGADQAWLEGLRRAHYPPGHNRAPAHLTLFRHLPPAVEAEARRRLAAETRGLPAPRATMRGVMNLGEGTALWIDSPALEDIRARIADAFQGLLTPQDRAAWRPHVTIQNKVTTAEARALQRLLEADLRPRPMAIAALALWRYQGGPWEPVSRHAFG